MSSSAPGGKKRGSVLGRKLGSEESVRSAECQDTDSFARGVWVIKEGEPLPVVVGARLMRAGLLADALATRGVPVLWWTSRFQHAIKRKLDTSDRRIHVRDNLDLEVLDATVVYSRNASVRRLVYHWLLGRALRARMRTLPDPAVIYCAFPSIDLAYEAVRYASKKGIPIVVDVRDLWPEIFVRAVPAPVRLAAAAPLSFLERKARKALHHATIVTAITQSAMEWVDRKGVVPRLRQVVVPLGAPEPPKDEDALGEALKHWNSLGVTADTWNICFFGTLSAKTMDLETAIAAAKRLADRYPSIKLVICGSGDQYARLQQLAGDNPNILLPGWVNHFSIHALMRISKVALYPLRNLVDMRDTISNKLLEYLSGSLPVVVCPTGAARELVTTHGAGVGYDEGDASSLTEALQSMVENESLRQRMADNAYACYDKNYRAELSNDRMIAVLEQAVRIH